MTRNDRRPGRRDLNREAGIEPEDRSGDAPAADTVGSPHGGSGYSPL
ncbi:hypothetical protein ABIA30_004815 [Mycobacterium sp. MAA66]